MISLSDHDTIAAVLARAAQAWGDRSLLAVPANASRAYLPQGEELSYAHVLQEVTGLAQRYRRAGYGLGHRVALSLESRPEHLLHKLALNSIGACCVPINPDYRASEISWLVGHAKPDLVVTLAHREPQIAEAVAMGDTASPAVDVMNFERELPEARRAAVAGLPGADSVSSILYTSGTTGRPKGCMLTQRYELAAGAWYAARGYLAAMRAEGERLYNPLPLYHVNASILSFWCMALTGGCQVQSDRFHPLRWWDEIATSRASVVHYLGVIIPMLLNQPLSATDRSHGVRFGVGAGVEPQLHAAFESRFGFPLLELWGMTENVRVFIDNTAPRQIGTRAFGRPDAGLEARVADSRGEEVERGTAGELLIRHSAQTPRRDFFAGYLDDHEATEAAWAGGWFHTGDIVTQDDTGMLHFVDRQKNIIRRSGENIAAAEVEALLLTHPDVAEAAVLAVRDEVREEEVLACVVLKGANTLTLTEGADGNAAAAADIVRFCLERIAYYKAPGWIVFRRELPKTGTQKIQKHQIFAAGSDPVADGSAIDLRHLKRRG